MMDCKVQCVIISGDRCLDDLLHRMDVFEKFKACATYTRFEISLNVEATPEKLEEVISHVVRSAQNIGQRVVAAFVPGCPYGVFLDPTVKVVSDGKNWCLIEDLLKYLGFEKTDPTIELALSGDIAFHETPNDP